MKLLGYAVAATFVLSVGTDRPLLAQANTFQVSSGQPWIDVTGQGAYLDAQTSCSAAVGGSGTNYTVTLSPPSTFSTAFYGEEIWLQGSTAAPPVVGTITTVSSATSASVTLSSATPAPATGSGLCVTWGHDDVYALQASLNLLNGSPFNGVGGEIKIPHGKTGLMMIGQQTANLSGGAGTYSGVSTVTLAPGQTFGSAVGARVTIANCMTGASVPFYGSFVVTGWDPTTGELSYNQKGRATTDTCTNGYITETGVYAPTQTAYVIEAENKTGAGQATVSGVELLGGFQGGFIINIGERGMDLNPAPRIQGLQFNDVSGTGASPGGLLCTQCLNGEFVGLSFVNFTGIDMSLGSGINRLSAGLTFSSSLTGGDFITTTVGGAPMQISQPDTEINSVYGIRCANNAVCIDAGSTIGSDQDGPHIFGGYISVGNRPNQNITQPPPVNTQSCTGIWASGPVRYYGGLMEVGADSPDNCLGIWSTGGAAEIIAKFEQHGSGACPGTGCYGTGVYINPGPAMTVTRASGQITQMKRDTSGSYVTVTLSIPVPFFQGQIIQVSGVSPESTYTNCTFNTVNSGSEKAIVASVPTTYTFTYLQPCAADGNQAATLSTGAPQIMGLAVANDIVDGFMYNFYIPVEVGSGATNNTIRISPGATTGTMDVVDAGTATDFTVNGLTAGQVHQQIGVSSPGADIFDICGNSAGCSSTPPLDRVDQFGNFVAPSANFLGTSPNAGFADFAEGNPVAANINSVGFQAPSSVTTPFHFTLPALPAAGLLRGDGTGPVTLSLQELTGDATTSGSNVVTVGGVDGVTYPASPSVNTVPVVTGTNTVTYEIAPLSAGGTGSAISAVAGGIPYFNTTTTTASSSALNQYGVLLGGGAGGAPTSAGADTTTTHALFATATAPAFRAIAKGDLPATTVYEDSGSSGRQLVAGQSLTLTDNGSGSTLVMDVTSVCEFAKTGDYITTATNFATTCTLPSSVLAGGSVIDIYAAGTWSTGSSGSPVAALDVSIGGTTVLPAASSLSLSTSQTNASWILRGRLVVLTTGTSGTAVAEGNYQFYTTTGGLSGDRGLVNSGGTAGVVPTVTINTTTPGTLEIGETASPASGQYFNLGQLVIRIFK